jgi:DNA-binding GntR family transcriptional regulator
MRANVEAWTARLAAERIEKGELVDLHHLADQMSELAIEPDEHGLDRIAELNIEFHRRISGSVGSERMTQMRSSVVHLPFLYKVFRTFTPQQIVLTTDEHHTILMALEARDADWAESITRAHILAALSSLLGPHGIFELAQGDDPA